MAQQNASPTEKQRQTISLIARLKTEQGYPPSVRELASHIGIALSVCQVRLARLRARGLVTWVEGKNRTLEVTEKGTKEIKDGQSPVS